MPQDNSSLIKELQRIEAEIKALGESLSDKEFVKSPSEVLSYLKKIIPEKNKLYQQELKKIDFYEKKLQSLVDEASNLSDSGSADRINSEIEDAPKKIEEQTLFCSKLFDEIKSLQDRQKLIQSEKYARYQQLLAERFNIKKQLGIATESERKEIMNQLSTMSDKTFNLIENAYEIYNKNPAWFGRAGLELKDYNPEGFPPMRLTRANSTDWIEVRERSVVASEITEENMRKLVPPLVALFLECTKHLESPGCSISGDYTPEVRKYVEEMIANKMKNNLAFTINGKSNGKSCEQILKEASSTPSVTEPIESIATNRPN